MSSIKFTKIRSVSTLIFLLFIAVPGFFDTRFMPTRGHCYLKQSTSPYSKLYVLVNETVPRNQTSTPIDSYAFEKR